ncbi:MAG: hypothetical protein AAB288_01940 [Acidobacteriota bacterium]
MTFKTKLCCLAALAVVLTVSPAHALSLGRLKPEKQKWYVGLSADRLDADARDAKATSDLYTVQRTGILLDAGYGLMDWLSAYLTVGTSAAETRDEADASGPSIGKIDMGSSFAWGMGANWGFDVSSFRIGGDIRFLLAPGHEFNSTGLIANGTSELNQFHSAFTLSRPFHYWAPYLGIRYTTTTVDVSIAGTKAQLELEDNVGAALGAEIMPKSRWGAQVELRFIGETSFTLGSTWKF